MYALNNNATYFDSFGVEHTPKEVKMFIDKYIVVTNIIRIQAYNSVMCGYFWIRFIDFMLVGKTLTPLLIFFPRNNLKETMI